jgi:radical SAM superfamily enzyme with C-terminal helix-hairpin-helix motif
MIKFITFNSLSVEAKNSELKDAKTVNFISLVSKPGKYEATRKVNANEMKKAKKRLFHFSFASCVLHGSLHVSFRFEAKKF